MNIPAIVAAQMGKIEEVKGILILAKTDDIPQDAVFLPLKEVNDEPIAQIFEKALIANDHQGIVLYFQSMRWNNADLLADIKKANQTTGLVTNREALRLFYLPGDTVRILTGIIAFERIPLHLELDRKPEPLKLMIAEKEYAFIISDRPLNTGYSIYFKPILAQQVLY